jgi:DNA-binding transcriptional ArsR family regulator
MRTSLRREVHQLHAEICQALSDPTRILILYELHDGPKNVGELAEAVETTQPTVSRHLKVLRERRLAIAAREGTNVYYHLADRRVIEALDLLRAMLGQILEDRQELAAGIAALAVSANAGGSGRPGAG